MSDDVILAVDCGASSGRVMAGHLENGACRLEEIHRFVNGGVFREGRFVWDWGRLTAGIETGIAAALARYPQARSLGIDTWGVDFGLLDADGSLIEEPVHHRDERTGRQAEAMDAVGTPVERFAASGVRPLPINTLEQLVALRAERPEVLAAAERLLGVPDLLAYGLTGVAVDERSFVSTTGCARPGAATWNRELLAEAGIPTDLFGEIVSAGTGLGPIRPAKAEACGVPAGSALMVLATAAHDTAAAVAAVPAAAGPVCYISSGTWSLLGTLIDAPLLDPAVLAAGFSNEVAADGRIRLLKNIMGLWILQECRRSWQEAGDERSWPELEGLAGESDPPVEPLGVDDQRFLGPGVAGDTMPQRVAGWYRERGLAVPQGIGPLVRAIYEGLAAEYARSVRGLEETTGQSFAAIHVIGGGSRDRLLCRLTAERCGLPVVAGPSEATALGNVLVQAAGLGLLAFSDFPDVVGASGELAHYG